MTGAVTKMAHVGTQAFPAASSGWEIMGGGAGGGGGKDAGRKEELPLPPPQAHISGVESEVGAFLQPWSRISFSLDLDGPEIGSYSHGRRRSPPPPMTPLFLLLFPSCCPLQHKGDSEGAWQNMKAPKCHPFSHFNIFS